MLVDDMEIVNVTSELCSQLNITRFRPREVVWTEWNPVSDYLWLAGTLSRAGPPDTKKMRSDWAIPYRGRIFLASTLKEKLTAKDWKPIIASALIYNFDQGLRGSKLNSMTKWILFSSAYLGLAMVGAFVGGLISLIALIVAPSLIVPLALVYARKTSKVQRELFLRADLKAAELVGREGFLSALRRIDELRLVDVERNKVESAKRSWRSQGPSITERIDNLLWGGTRLGSQLS